MGCGTSFIKYTLFFFNLVVALLGLAVVAVGVVFLVKWTVVTNELKAHITVAPWVFIVIGTIMFTIAFFGCCGAIRESHCMVVTYAIFLLVIIIVQVVIAVLMFVYGDNIKNQLTNSIDVLYNKSNSERDDAVKELVNNLEMQLGCCGRVNGIIEYDISLPRSCCPRDENMWGCTAATVFQQGCRDKIASMYDQYNKPVAGVAIFIACVEVVGALFALCLANSIRNMDRRSRY